MLLQLALTAAGIRRNCEADKRAENALTVRAQCLGGTDGYGNGYCAVIAVSMLE